MALRKVSHKRIEEEINRGHDIITNGAVKGGLSQTDKTDYMKKPINTWTRLQKAQMTKEDQSRADIINKIEDRYDELESEGKKVA